MSKKVSCVTRGTSFLRFGEFFHFPHRRNKQISPSLHNVLFYSCYPELKKKSKIRAFLAKLRCFFRAPRFEAYFSVSSCERPYARPYPRSDSHERGRAKLPDHLFSDTVFTMKTLFYSNHCKLCIKYIY